MVDKIDTQIKLPNRLIIGKGSNNKKFSRLS